MRSFNNGYLDIEETADQVVTRTVGDASWPRWEFNDIDVSAASDPANKYFFAVQVEGVPTHTTIWAHGADARTYFPERDIPARSC